LKIKPIVDKIQTTLEIIIIKVIIML